jgi:hypothetical protein
MSCCAGIASMHYAGVMLTVRYYRSLTISKGTYSYPNANVISNGGYLRRQLSEHYLTGITMDYLIFTARKAPTGGLGGVKALLEK